MRWCLAAVTVSAEDRAAKRQWEEEKAHWERLTHILPEQKWRLWQTLAVAEEKFHGVLEQRSNLLADTTALRQQNAELRALLEEYFRAKVGCLFLGEHFCSRSLTATFFYNSTG